jgi:hypothetical protein
MRVVVGLLLSSVALLYGCEGSIGYYGTGDSGAGAYEGAPSGYRVHVYPPPYAPRVYYRSYRGELKVAEPVEQRGSW